MPLFWAYSVKKDSATSEETAHDHSWIPLPVKQPNSVPIEDMRGARIG